MITTFDGVSIANSLMGERRCGVRPCAELSVGVVALRQWALVPAFAAEHAQRLLVPRLPSRSDHELDRQSASESHPALERREEW
jgi:hypothetical protein